MERGFGLLSLSTLALLLMFLGGPASAAPFVFGCPPSCPSSDGAGRMVSSELSFDDATQQFSWTAVFEAVGGQLPDGLYIVVNDGPEPELTSDGLAILYGDGATGRVSAHVYDRVAKERSFEEMGSFIESVASALSFIDNPDGTRTLSLILDATGINMFMPVPNWRGVQFGETVGVWAHPTSGTEVSFDASGAVLDYRRVGNTSYDRNDRVAVLVPEPATALLLGLGLLGLEVSARRASHAA